MEVKVEEAAWRLAEALRIETISHSDPSLMDGEAFLAMHDYLAATFPRAHEALTREPVNNYSLLYTWPGSDPNLRPLLLLAHLDVVPVEPGTELSWSHPAFGGVVDDGYIWGRGAIDDKVSALGIMEAVEALLASGFAPKRTILIAFGHDEELGGANGAGVIAALLESLNVRPLFSLDEGGYILDGVLPGLPAASAMIATAEKGYLSLRLTARGAEGHSSMPPPQTALGRVAAAIYRLESSPFALRMSPPVVGMIDHLAPEMEFPAGVFMSNRRLFGGTIMDRASRSPVLNALLRTTTAATMARAGVKDNVLPSEARAVINFRILPGDTVDSVTRHVVETIDDALVQVEPMLASEPSAVADSDGPEYDLLHRTVREVFPNVLVAPMLSIGGTDSRHYARVVDNAYRFAPIYLENADLKMIHGIDERISVDNYRDLIRFYARLMENAAG